MAKSAPGERQEAGGQEAGVVVKVRIVSISSKSGTICYSGSESAKSTCESTSSVRYSGNSCCQFYRGPGVAWIERSWGELRSRPAMAESMIGVSLGTLGPYYVREKVDQSDIRSKRWVSRR